MTKSQEKAIARFRQFLEIHQCRTTCGHKMEITNWETRDLSYFIGVSAGIEFSRTEPDALPDGNLLRALDREYWSAHIGRLGAITVRMCPKSFEQFHGQRVFGLNFKVK